jgi:gliding motility-associated-like protein
MKRKLLLTIFSLFIYAGLNAQIGCNLPAPPGVSCESAQFFCNGEIDGYCSTLPSGGADGPNPLCPGAGVPNNIHWMAFAAGTTDINLQITPSNCASGGQQGIQAGVYDDCDFGNSIACEGNCQTNVFTLNLNDLNVGQVYYLLIDGCAGNVCEYELDVTSGSTVAPAPSLPIFPIIGNDVVCNGLQDVAYVVPEVTFGTNYMWTLPPGATYEETNDLGNEITVNFGDQGGQICVTVNNDCHPDPLGPVCIDITMQPTPSSTIIDTYCTGGCYFYEATGDCFTGPGPHEIVLANASFAGCDSIVMINLTSFDLPPFDLDLTYCENDGCVNYNGDCWEDGLWNVVYFGASFQGCDSTVNLTVTELVNTEAFIEVALCGPGPGELDPEYLVCGIPYSTPLAYQGFQIECPTNFVGCDSTINLDLYILTPIVDIQPPGALGCGTNPSVYLDAFGSIGDTYLWETVDGAIEDDPTSLFFEVNTPGTYCLTATSTHFYGAGGQFSCTDQMCVTVSAETELPMTSVASTDVGCPGDTDGTIIITLENPSIGDVTYDWMPLVSVSNVATDLAAGTYTVVITSDENGCSTTETVVIGTPDAITIGTTQTNIACNGDETGTATATPAGGSGGFQYLWCNSQTSATATNLPVGICQVIVTDMNGCVSTVSVDITQATAMVVSIVPTNVSCNNTATGSATASTTGGTGPYTYVWTPSGQTGPTAINLVANTYTVVSTDSEGCTAEQTVVISEPSAVTATTQQADLLCDGDSNGTATVNPAGGVGNFTFLWCNSNTTAMATGLPSGPCSVTVTDGNGCSIIETVTIIEPNPLSVSVTGTDITCFGEMNGTATATVNGGTGSLGYAWCNSQSTETATGLDVGTCCVIVTDGNGCTAEDCVTLTQPATALSIVGTSTPAACGNANGTISTTASGGTPTYTYAWSGGADPVANPVGLSPGGYTVTVTDMNDCTETFTINVDTPSGLLATAVATPASCNGGTDGTVTVTVNGGTAPFGYIWDPTSIPDDETAPTDLAAGDYGVTVSDASGCTFVTSATVEEPEEITIVGNTTDENCGESDGTISTNVQGGTEPYTYAWTPGTAMGPNPTGLSEGNYMLVVTDDNDCTAEFEITIATPAALMVTVVGEDAACNGEASGSITTTASGGVGPYTYEWDGGLGNDENPEDVPAGTYILTLTDDTGCSITASVVIGEPEALSMTFISNEATCGEDNGSIEVTVSGGVEPYEYDWSNGDNSDNPTGLGVGDQTVTVIDANDCEFIQTIEITEPEPLALDVTANMVSCFDGADGEIDLTVTGGTMPFDFDWGTQIVEDPTNLVADDYTVVVTDFNGCSETISITVDQPEEIDVQATSSDASCGQPNGSITSFTTGGTAPYIYDWSDPAMDVPSPTDLPPGSYEAIVTDANGCTFTVSVNVETPVGLALTTAVIDEPCNGDALGAIDLEVTGGVAPFDYIWDNAGEITQDINGLTAGLYNVTVTDATGCSILAAATVSEPDVIVLASTIIEATCGNANGGVSLTVAGGTMPYSYLWNGTIPDQNPTDLQAGDYSVIVTDANGCTAELTTTVTTPEELLASATQVDVSCNGGADGIIDLTTTGGTAPFTYQWTNGSLDEDPTGLTAGDISGTVMDANGCQAMVTLTLQEPDAITFESISADATCGEPNGSIDLTVTGGTSPYTFDWDLAPDVEDPIDIISGPYTVIVTDFNGCTAEYSTAVNTPNELVLNAVVTDADCFGASTGNIDLSVTGGVAPFVYEWPAWNGEDLTDAPAGSYTVIVTDATDCSVSLTEVIAEPTAITIDGTSTDALCGQSNGTIDIIVAGGTPAYTFDWGTGIPPVEDPQDLAIGNYSVVVTDDNGCTAQYDISVNTPNGLALTEASTDASCNGGADGTASVTPMGGTPPFTYLWSTLEITASISGLSIGTVGCTVTDDDGCDIISSSIIGEPDVIVINGNTTEETCDNNNGTATITTNGGTAPYTYLWSNGSTDQNPTGLVDGPITVTVTDINSCTMEETFNVTEPAALSGVLTPSNVSCNAGADGSIDPVIFGGVGPYEYLYMPGNITDQTPMTLTAGDYTLQVTDANGCTLVLLQTLTEPDALATSFTSVDALCGEDNGSVDLTVTGGTTPYTYEWSNLTTNEDPDNLGGGSFDVTVTDANDCTIVATAVVSTPAMLETTVTGTDTNCFGESDGSAVSDPSGGTMPYTYLWTGGSTDPDLSGVPMGNYLLTLTDATGCTVTAAVSIGQPDEIVITPTSTDAQCQADDGTVSIAVIGGTTPYTYLWSNGEITQNIMNLGVDNYTVTITDGNMCTQEVTQPVGQPDQVAITEVIVDATCDGEANGSINITPSGGVGPFTFEWSNGETTEDVTDLAENTYTVTITDDNGCPAPFTFDIADPDALNASTEVAFAIDCSGQTGSAIVTPTGGTPGYTFLWENGSTNNELTNVGVGTYNVTVTDANGCETFSLVEMSQPDALVVTPIANDALCHNTANGSIDLVVSGGIPPYTFDWSNGTTDQNAQNLVANTYTVEVTDANGCSATEIVIVEAPEEAVASIGSVSEYSGFNVSCSDSDDGAATIQVSGGTAPYNYIWSSGDSTATAETLTAGTYTVTVVDDNGCVSDVVTVDLLAPEAMSVLDANIDVSCFGDSDGAIIITDVFGGAPPHMYSLEESPFSQLNLFGSLEPGTYEVVVQDANGCEATFDQIVEDAPELQVTLSLDLSLRPNIDENEIQLGDSAQINVQLNIDTMGLQQYGWTQGGYWTPSAIACDTCFRRMIYPFENTLYEYLVVDENGCIGREELLVTVIKDRAVYIPNAFSPNGDGNNDRFFIHAGIEVESISLFKVYNRWGEVVYELNDFFANDPTTGWDGTFNGKFLNPGVYVYHATILFKDGRIELKKGDVTLMK